MKKPLYFIGYFIVYSKYGKRSKKVNPFDAC